MNLIQLLSDDFSKEIREKLEQHGIAYASGFGNFSSKCFVLADLLKKRNYSSVLWIVNDKNEQEAVERSFSLWSGFKVYSLVKDDESRDKERINRLNLIESISYLNNEEKTVVVANYESLLQKAPDKNDLLSKILKLEVESEYEAVELFEELISIGYEVSEDNYLEKGRYLRKGDVLTVFPVNYKNAIRITFDFDKIEAIDEIDQLSGDVLKNYKNIEIYPLEIECPKVNYLELLDNNSLIVDDDLEIIENNFVDFEEFFKRRDEKIHLLNFSSFPEEEKFNVHEQYLSVIRYQNPLEMVDNLQERYLAGWKIFIFTKHFDEITGVLKEKNIPFDDKSSKFNEKQNRHPLKILKTDKDGVLPGSFQNPRHQVFSFSDKEIASFKTQKKSLSTQSVYLDFLTSLKINDYVVHADHGIARFGGIERKTVDEITREYMKLLYAENDKLYVPIDQADKVNKYIGADDSVPKLTRLGSSEWNTITRKVKEETQKIAKELLALYAQREMSQGFKYREDDEIQRQFEETFQYEETPGQIKAFIDVKKDMEKIKPMDRLVCGDVGFGKTEVAMRASFKAVRNGKQVAFVSPITILADQHYRSFKKRMDDFDVRVEMLSRFKSQKEAKDIIKKLSKGEIDIIIGTHRLLQDDMAFKNLGLVIIDEEQRFGVKQKEKLKELRAEVDILTLTATPIPRTLNIALNKLRDITTITTPPPGRLPVVTEVRKFSLELIKEAIYKEVERGGQAYVLHNRVQTIDSFAEKLKNLCKDVRFVVAHGKLSSTELEKRIIAFKNGEFDVLVSSTIIENGIDLANANTLIVNNAEKFGLSQLYQLRGRVGRGKRQAYAYFLYHAQRLKLDAKKRLRAIVEASELGSGFQIAMKDLEIRGAGDILGANQHGAINVVGVSHFIRMLNKAVEEMKEGRINADGDLEEVQDIAIELPISAYIPDEYIASSKDKISAYQKLSSADNFVYLEELKEDLIEEYGKMPNQVLNLFKVLELKISAKKSHLINVRADNIHDTEKREIVLTMGKLVKPENIIKLLEHNSKFIISGNKLKIKTRDLGMNWFDELHECIKVMIPG